MRKSLQCEYVGLTEYQTASSLQKTQHELVVMGANDFVLGLEHPFVITLGRRANLEDILAPYQEFSITTDRGGQVTLHSPGQLVIYPMVSLLRHHISVREYVCLLMKSTQDCLIKHGIETVPTHDGAGLLDLYGKIAFCGIRIENGVSRHGISINVCNDLSLFKRIVPCGVSTQAVSSMQKHFTSEYVLNLRHIFDCWIECFVRRLDKGQSDTENLNCQLALS